MASNSYPRPGYNSGSLSSVEHEILTRLAIPDAVHGHPNDAGPVLANTTATRTVNVRANIHAHVRGSFYQSGGTEIPLVLQPNTSGAPRIDRITLRLDRSTYIVKEHVLLGTPAANPVAPALRQDSGVTGFWDFGLADVRVENNASIITQDKITRRCWYIGSDGQIRCTSDTRPPPEAGRVVWEHPAGRYLVGTGNRWLVAVEESGKAAMTVNTSLFVATHNTLWRRNGWAWAELTANRPSGQLNPNTLYTVATLPAGYRPDSLFQFALVVPGNNQSVGVGSVSPDGLVRVNPGGKAIPAGYNFVCAIGSWPIAA